VGRSVTLERKEINELNLVSRNESTLSSPGSRPGSNTGCKEALANLSTWFGNCLHNHAACGEGYEGNTLPTRVLDLEPQGNPGGVCLHITNPHSPKSPYATLSHCWGSVLPLRLEQENMVLFQSSIAQGSLPKTFQDAVQITRHLGLRFLWIDSLCIIQDSPEDWEIESSNMGSVYENSICNIAASAAPDGRAGCFFDRHPLLVQPCEALVTPLTMHYFYFDDDGEEVNEVELKDPQLCQILPQHVWEEGVTSAVLNGRAWVAQERMLSPRTIHFGKKQLFWECRELVSS
jgi:hypothetical protein